MTQCESDAGGIGCFDGRDGGSAPSAPVLTFDGSLLMFRWLVGGLLMASDAFSLPVDDSFMGCNSIKFYRNP